MAEHRVLIGNDDTRAGNRGVGRRRPHDLRLRPPPQRRGRQIYALFDRAYGKNIVPINDDDRPAGLPAALPRSVRAYAGPGLVSGPLPRRLPTAARPQLRSGGWRDESWEYDFMRMVLVPFSASVFRREVCQQIRPVPPNFGPVCASGARGLARRSLSSPMRRSGLKLVSDLLRGGFVDPGGGGQVGRGRRPADEPFGVMRVSSVEHASAGGVEFGRASVVHGGRGHQPDPRVAVLVVVPVEEAPAELARLLDRVEPVRKLGPVLERLEVRLGVGVVGRGVRSAVGLGDAERRPVALLTLWSFCRSGSGWWPRRERCGMSSLWCWGGGRRMARRR